jgi:hypothetical protein
VTVEPWQAILAAVIAILGPILAARYAARSAVKVKQLDVDGQAYLRAEGITAGLIEQLRKQVDDLQQDRLDDKAARDADKAEHQKELAKRDVRLDALEHKLRALGDHNQALTTFVYVVLAILRRHGLIGEINPQDVPDGIRI